MSKKRYEKYMNPDAPPGYAYKPPEPCEDPGIPPEEKYGIPDAPPNLFKCDSHDNIYLEEYKMEIETCIFKKPIEGDLSDFYINTSDEDSSSSGEVREIDVRTKEIESKIKDISISKKKYKKHRSERSEKSDRPEKARKREAEKGKKRKRSISSSSSLEIIPHEDPKDPKKPEGIEEPEHLFGSYFCDICNIKMNSEAIYESHIVGKRHLKAVKMRNVAATVAKTVPMAEEASRYPKPPQGIFRQRVNEEAKIQEVVEKKLKSPCPGLHKVIEIQGLQETLYYCELCDSTCSMNCIMSHLGGFKHQLNSLEYFDKDRYNSYKGEARYKIEKHLITWLKSIEKKHGIGRMTVEREFFDEDNAYASTSKRGNGWDPSQAGPSQEKADFPEDYDETSVPDKSMSGFYCKLCESHMNSLGMWETHIRGKRHAANKKRLPGSKPSKIKNIPLPGARAYLLDDIQGVGGAGTIVGLDHVREIRNLELKAELYQCLLCNSCHTNLDIVDHVLDIKHKRFYLDQIKHPEFTYLKSMDFTENAARSLIEDICTRVQFERGPGHPAVFVKK